jgi:O-antigen ligase
VPLVFDPRIGGHFRLPKTLVAQSLGLLCLLLLVLASPRLDAASLRRAFAAPALAAVAPLVLVATALAAVSQHPEHVQRGLAGLWIAAACLVGWSLGFTRPELERALLWTLPGAALSGLLGLAQALGLYQPFGFARDATVAHARFEVIGLAGNAGDLGASLVLPCLIAQARAARGGLGWLLATAVCALGVLASQTVTAIAALAVGSALLWLPRLARRRWRARSLAAVAAGVLAVLLGLAFGPARERVLQKGASLAEGDWNELLSGRLDGWRAAVEMFVERPFTGVGQGAFRAAFVDAKAALLEKGSVFFEAQPFPVFANAHNEPLEVAAETGLPGLVALGWALWLLGRRLRAGAVVAAPGERALAAAGLGALALLSLTGFPFRIAVVAFPALLFLAWLLADPEPEAAP